MMSGIGLRPDFVGAGVAGAAGVGAAGADGPDAAPSPVAGRCVRVSGGLAGTGFECSMVRLLMIVLGWLVDAWLVDALGDAHRAREVDARQRNREARVDVDVAGANQRRLGVDHFDVACDSRCEPLSRLRQLLVREPEPVRSDAPLPQG